LSTSLPFYFHLNTYSYISTKKFNFTWIFSPFPIVGFELRASYLLGRQSTVWTMPPAYFCLSYFSYILILHIFIFNFKILKLYCFLYIVKLIFCPWGKFSYVKSVFISVCLYLFLMNYFSLGFSVLLHRWFHGSYSRGESWSCPDDSSAHLHKGAGWLFDLNLNLHRTGQLPTLLKLT
jgi:hypothetical protein